MFDNHFKTLKYNNVFACTINIQFIFLSNYYKWIQLKKLKIAC